MLHPYLSPRVAARTAPSSRASPQPRAGGSGLGEPSGGALAGTCPLPPIRSGFGVPFGAGSRGATLPSPRQQKQPLPPVHVGQVGHVVHQKRRKERPRPAIEVDLLSGPDLPSISRICRDSYMLAADLADRMEVKRAQQRCRLDRLTRSRDRRRAGAAAKRRIAAQQDPSAGEAEAEAEVVAAAAAPVILVTKTSSLKVPSQMGRKDSDADRRCMRRMRAQSDRFRALKNQEQEALAKAFERCCRICGGDADDGTRLEEPAEEPVVATRSGLSEACSSTALATGPALHACLREALLDLGVIGMSPAERAGVAALLAELCTGSAAFDLVGFSLDVVAVARRTLLRLRQETLRTHLERCRRHYDGNLVREDVLLVAELSLPIEVFYSDDDDSQMSEQLLGRMHAACDKFITNEAEVGHFVDELMSIAEERFRHDADVTREIQARFALSEEAFCRHRRDLVILEKLFTESDTDGNGFLSSDDAMEHLSKLGIAPASNHDRRRVQDVVDLLGDQADFAAFVDLVEAVRKIFEQQPDEATERLFEQHAPGAATGAAAGVSLLPDGHSNPPKVALRLVRELLTDMGLLAAAAAVAPRTVKRGSSSRPLSDAVERRRGDLLDAVLQDVDPDGTDLFSFAQVRRATQLLRELRRRREQLQELRTAREYGYGEKTLKELKETFSTIDESGNGLLSKAEVQRAFRLMSVEMRREDVFDAAFLTFDGSGCDSLNFCEFVGFLKTVVLVNQGNAGEIAASPFGRRRVTCLQELPPLGLLLVLEKLKASSDFAEDSAALERGGEEDDDEDERRALQLGRASSFLGLGPLNCLERGLGVTTLSGLLEYAEKLAATAVAET
eukprot:TRINITY_DN7801_c0_g3_i1.p1 TRINITY_DN7801_c0_g3~~TRINITY_DN7801_c0_g3_i1.p1  ORF type:complete len:846 (-),score=217.37 TRINITY_DN7801_c0_g3_i1:67-2604(-)